MLRMRNENQPKQMEALWQTILQKGEALLRCMVLHFDEGWVSSVLTS